MGRRGNTSEDAAPADGVQRARSGEAPSERVRPAELPPERTRPEELPSERVRPEELPPAEREARAAIAIAGGLYFVGASLTATAVLLPHVGSPAGIVSVALDGLLTSALLFFAANRGWGGLRVAFAADLWGIVLIALLCAFGGGADSPFALIYFFALGHAAAFQPRGRFLFVCAAVLLAFLLPLVYEAQVSSMFGAVASVGIVLALLTAGVVHMSLNRMREQRRRLEILIAATAELGKSLDPSETLHTIAHMAVPGLAALCVVDLLDDSGGVGASAAAALQPEVAKEVERMRAAVPLDLHAEHPLAEVLDGGVAYAIHRADEQPAGAVGEHERALHDAGFGSAAAFPMVARGRTVGVISFWQLDSYARYDSGLLAVYEDLAGRAAMALDNARLYAERARVARTLRRSLMPAVLPTVPGLQLASYFRPMGAGEEVGGDFYDAFGDRDGCWLVVGDVCGKGAEAAALTGFLRHTTAAYAREEQSPARVLEQVNRAMLDQEFDGRFATAILARLRFRRTRVELTLAVAGHPGALVARADGSVSELDGSGTLLGVFPEPGLQDVSATLAPGDSFALYTDGLAEAHAPTRILTVQEMLARLRDHAPEGAQDAIDSLLGLIDLEHRVGDDIAILAVHVERAAAGVSASRSQPDLLTARTALGSR
jgi:Stage II sporulation protein E (SpoIIE)/GAF domain